jgi:hypothetical protein
MKTAAEFSADRRYRWWLSREWDEGGTWCAFIGLNPSTADENADDPTIRRCINFARSWGHNGLLMLNLYAYRATDPREMWDAQNKGISISGVQNYFSDLILRPTTQFPQVSRLIAAWGTGGGERGKEFGIAARMVGVKLDCLMKTKHGHPQHPLYLPSGLLPEPWNYRSEA